MYTTEDFLKERAERRANLANVASQMEAEIAQSIEAEAEAEVENESQTA